MLHLPRKVTPMLGPRHIWNLIYNALSNRCHHPNLTKYCACHEKWHCNISKKMSENSWNVISNAGTIRPWSENDPTMIRPWSDHETVSPQPASQPRLLFELANRIFYWIIQRFAPNLTLQHSPSTAPATKKWHLNVTKYCTCHEKWHLNLTKCCTCHEMWHLNVTKYCTCHEKWHLNLTKCCTCHEK